MKAMKITILGSGTGVPRKERAAPGYFIEAGEQRALLDSGSGTLRRLAEIGGDYRTLNAIFYTHTHPDHIADFVPLLFALKYTPDFVREKPLLVYGPVGMKAFYQKAIRLFGNWLAELPFEMPILELTDNDLTWEHLNVHSAMMNHSEGALGFRFGDKKGHSFVFSGDTDVTPNLPELARETDLLLLECSFPDDQKVAGHLTPTEAGVLAEEARAKRLILTHFYPPCDDSDSLSVVKHYFSGEARLAQDGMVVGV